MKYYLGPLLLSLSMIGFTGCKKDLPTGADGSPSDIVFPASDVNYTNHVQRLFTQTCALSGCHGEGNNQSTLKLTTYAGAVLSLPGVVVPGNPDASTLVLRIEGRVSPRMPLNRNPLNQNQIDGIKTWIREGASNN